MVACGLDYSIRKKLDTQYLRDMAQLADRVFQVKRLKAEKARSSKYNKKEKVAYVETNCYMEAEQKPRPPYVCKLLKPSNEKNHVEPNKNEKFVIKTYTFDIIKGDKIFYLLVTDGKIVVPPGLKTPSLEQRKKLSFCKYHNFLGHRTFQCVLFRNLV